jgi:hypothetical protein
MAGGAWNLKAVGRRKSEKVERQPEQDIRKTVSPDMPLQKQR